jgi:hypothetical protein
MCRETSLPSPLRIELKAWSAAICWIVRSKAQ